MESGLRRWAYIPPSPSDSSMPLLLNQNNPHVLRVDHSPIPRPFQMEDHHIKSPLGCINLYKGLLVGVLVDEVRGFAWLLLDNVEHSRPRPVNSNRGLAAQLWLPALVLNTFLHLEHPLQFLFYCSGIVGSSVRTMGHTPAGSQSPKPFPYVRQQWAANGFHSTLCGRHVESIDEKID